MDSGEILRKANEIAGRYGLKAEFVGDEPLRSVCVRGDQRGYLPVMCIIGQFPGWDTLEEISSEITNTLLVSRLMFEDAQQGNKT